MTAVELQDLSIGYTTRGGLRGVRRHTVTEAVDAVARRGELTVLIGPNGAGKSTLIRTMCGLQPSLTGRIVLGEDDLAGMTADRLAQRVAVVLTDRVDAGLLSARELVGLGRTPHLGLGGRLSARDHEIVRWSLDEVGARELADRPAMQLSDGERQRVLTARALAQEPDLLVLDEPTAFLDVPSRVALMELLRRLARERDLAVLLSTHDLELALRVADHVWLMSPGGGFTSGTPEELALSGKIGDTFNRGDLRFDPATGVFVLAPSTEQTPARTVRIRAEQPAGAALGRMLGRNGYIVVESGAADLAITVDEDLQSEVRWGGEVLTASDLGRLHALVRDLQGDNDFSCSDPKQVAAALARVAVITPYFAVTSGAVGDEHWRPVAELYRDTAMLTELVEKVGRRISTTERRVAVSTMFLGYAARLWSIALGMLVRENMAVDLDPAHLLWRDDEGTVALHLASAQAWTGPDASTFVLHQIVEQHLRPLIDAVHRFEPLSRKLLWGNAASALVGSARVLDGGYSGPANDIADAFCAAAPLLDTVDRRDDGSTMRRSCCLYYRISDTYCGDCVLVPQRQR